MFCIISNQYPHRTTCGICHSLFQPAIGPELASIDTRELVCLGCGAESEPELVNLLKLARTAEQYAGDLAEAAGLAA